MTTVTVLSGPERRRRWTTAEKLRIVEESLAPGASVVEVARRHDVHRNLVTVWRRQARTGVLACGLEPTPQQDDGVRFAAVSVAPDRQPLTAPSGTCGAIEIEFAAGGRMRITGAVDETTLTAVVAAHSVYGMQRLNFQYLRAESNRLRRWQAARQQRAYSGLQRLQDGPPPVRLLLLIRRYHIARQ